jgi:DNA-binding response OmpR family regulator
VLLVSAGPELAEVAQRFELRAGLAKPFDMDVLRAVIEQLLAHPEPPPHT